MRLIKILTLAALLSALPACAASTKYVSPPPPPRLAQPDSALTKDCDAPVDIGSAPLSQSNTEKFWMKDRRALIECRRGKIALRDFYIDRDGRLTTK
ncbi:dehydrogenase [Rhizobium sp. P44RR-XXIV]|nr:dehydrogenase [Rhizobium sp. P44RR-XXIV]